jgi:cell division protein FtsL
VTPPAASQAHAAPPLAPRRRPVAPSRPRRVSGPARPARQAPRPASAERGLVPALLRLFGGLDALASHRLVDRAIRSRVWIGIVAFALIGIVTLQLGLLKLNAGIGRSLERQSALQRENAALSVENSELQTGSRVETEAARLGMRLASVAGLKFLASHGHADVPKAASALKTEPTREATATPVEATGTEEEAASSGAAESSESGHSEEQTSEAESPGSESSSAASGEPAATGGGGTAEGASEEASSSVPAGEGGGAAAPGG